VAQVAAQFLDRNGEFHRVAKNLEEVVGDLKEVRRGRVQLFLKDYPQQRRN
jgi:hypothetical protein